MEGLIALAILILFLPWLRNLLMDWANAFGEKWRKEAVERETGYVSPKVSGIRLSDEELQEMKPTAKSSRRP
jgi:hypothetical protein